MTSLNRDLSYYWREDKDRNPDVYESFKSHNGIDCNCCTRNRPDPKLRDKSKTKTKGKGKRIRLKTRHGKLSQVEIDLAKGLIGK
jgi:hypothetical protein